MSTLNRLTNSSDTEDESSGAVSLPYAALLLGNSNAFYWLSQDRESNDGSLHIAAMLALPAVVRWLLETDDPNMESEEYDFWTPLAISCVAKRSPICIVANAEADIKARQRQCMQLLVPVSRPEWRDHARRTVLHIALESGADAASAMLKALENHGDSYRSTRYSYVDKNNRRYTLRKYVKEFVDDPDEQEALLRLLVPPRKRWDIFRP
jgi:ankyrin repeat protein